MTLTLKHKIVLVLSMLVIVIDALLLVSYFSVIVDWISHHLWVVIIPFAKAIFKRLIALQLVVFLKGMLILFWHVLKLLLLKLLKTFGVRYGVFFSQYRWYWARYTKVMFLRRGKQFFRRLAKFWQGYQSWQKWLILVAFFPVVLVLFLLGLSFNVTRKTMVKKAQESAIFGAATSASKSSKGIRAWLRRLDQNILKQIKQLLTTDKQTKSR